MAVLIDTLTDAAGRPRHPEKAHRPDQPALRKPEWIRVKAPVSAGYLDTQRIVRANGLHTVCEEAGCPNIGECWEQKHATFMIMGDTCTRACAFCNVKTGLPGALDPAEPEHVAEATAQARTRACRRHLGRPRRSRRRRGRPFRRRHRCNPCALSDHHHRSADARFFAKGRSGGDRRCGAPRRLQPQSGNRAVEISDSAARRALLRLDPAPATRQGDRPANVHQIRDHGRAR